MPSGLHVRDRIRKILKRRPNKKEREQPIEPKRQLAALQETTPPPAHVQEAPPVGPVIVEPTPFRFGSYSVERESAHRPSVAEGESTCPLDTSDQKSRDDATTPEHHGETGTPLGAGLDDALYPPSCGSTIRTPELEDENESLDTQVLQAGPPVVTPIPEESTGMHPGFAVLPSQLSEDKLNSSLQTPSRTQSLVSRDTPGLTSENVYKGSMGRNSQDDIQRQAGVVTLEAIDSGSSKTHENVHGQRPSESDQTIDQDNIDKIAGRSDPPLSDLNPHRTGSTAEREPDTEQDWLLWNKLNSRENNHTMGTTSDTSSNYDRDSLPSSSGSIGYGGLERTDTRPSIVEGQPTVDTAVVAWLKDNKPRFSTVGNIPTTDEHFGKETHYTTGPISSETDYHQGSEYQTYNSGWENPAPPQNNSVVQEGGASIPGASIPRTYQKDNETYNSLTPQETRVTNLHQMYNPAVVHEKEIPENREIVTKEVTREIHHHDHKLRVQPVLRTEFLPEHHVLIDENGNRMPMTQQQVDGEANKFPVVSRENVVVATSVNGPYYDA